MRTEMTICGRIGKVRVGGYRGRPCAFFGIAETVLQLDTADTPCHERIWHQCRCAEPLLVETLRSAEGRLVAAVGRFYPTRPGRRLFVIGPFGKVDFLDPVDFQTSPAGS